MKTPDEFAEAMKGQGTYPPVRPAGPFVVSATRKTKPTHFYWPAISNLEESLQALNLAVGAALFVAVVNAVVATISLVQHTAILGITPAGYIDASLFAIVGWGIHRRSRVAAVAGLSLFVAEKIYQFATLPKALVGIAMAVILLAFFVSGVRGTFAYHRFTSADAPEASAGQGS